METAELLVTVPYYILLTSNYNTSPSRIQTWQPALSKISNLSIALATWLKRIDVPGYYPLLIIVAMGLTSDLFNCILHTSSKLSADAVGPSRGTLSPNIRA